MKKKVFRERYNTVEELKEAIFRKEAIELAESGKKKATKKKKSDK